MGGSVSKEWLETCIDAAKRDPRWKNSQPGGNSYLLLVRQSLRQSGCLILNRRRLRQIGRRLRLVDSKAWLETAALKIGRRGSASSVSTVYCDDVYSIDVQNIEMLVFRNG